MAQEPVQPPLRWEDAIWTYRYLRMAMVGAVVVLAGSIAIERGKVNCWQTSISAYYYTPVRAIFVGAMLAVALALIAYKGKRPGEDICLNFAGMLAPIVAVAPTTDVGRCWSIRPIPLPVNDDGSLAEWVVANIDNNIHALLYAGIIGLVVSAIVKMVLDKSVTAPISGVRRGTMIALAVTLVALVLSWWLIENWDDFYTRAHGYAAVGMFGFLTLAIVANVVENWRRRSRDGRNVWSWVYIVVAGFMVVGAFAIWLTRYFEEHTVLVLEAYEIWWFAVYWIAQTVENWSEEEEKVETERSGRDAPAEEAASTQT